MSNKKVFFVIAILVVIIALVIVIGTTRKSKPEIIDPNASTGVKIPETTIKELFGINIVTDIKKVDLSGIDGVSTSNYAKNAFEQEFVGTSFQKSKNTSDINYSTIAQETDQYMTLYDYNGVAVLYILPIDNERYYISREPVSESNFLSNIYEKV